MKLRFGSLAAAVVALCAFGNLWSAGAQAPPCTWNATEPCYLQIGSVYEFRDRTSANFDRDDRGAVENDCDGKTLNPYIDAVNSLNGGRGFMVHSSGLEIAQSTTYPRYYYRLNYTRLTFDNWTQGEAMSARHFPTWSYVAGMGNGCNDALVVEQAKLATAAGRIWATPRGPWSQMSRATGMPLKWAFSSHLDSWDYARTASQQFALKGAKTAAVIFWCCSNTFFTGVGQGALEHLAENGIEAKVVAEIQENMTVLEAAVDEAINKKVDVILTSLTTDVFRMFLDKLESSRQQYMPDGIFAVNLPWMNDGTRCFGLGETCRHILTGAQSLAFPQITNALKDGVLGMTGAEFTQLVGFTPAYDSEIGLSAFIQAVQTVFQFREIRDPTDLLHSAADPDVYVSVRDLMLSGEVFGNTFASPASYSPLGQINGMDPPTATIADPQTLSILFPPDFADGPFEYPLPAALPCPTNTYKEWSNESCLLCQANCRHCPVHSERVDPAFLCSCRSGYYEGRDSRCVACPDGAVCEESGSILEDLNLSRGYWRYGKHVTDVYPCKTGDACLGGTAVGDDSCEEGHEGPRCEVCSHMFFYDSGKHKCLACESNPAFWGPVQLLALTLGLLLAIFSCFRKRIRKFLDEATNNGRAKFKEVKTKIKIAISLLQVMNMLPGVLPSITWPTMFLQFLNSLGIFNLSLLKVLPADCIHPNSFYDRLLINTLLPIIFWMILLLMCLIHQCRKASHVRAELQSGYIGAALLVAYLALPFTSNTIFDTFKCESFTTDTGQSRNFVAGDLSLDCDTDRHRNFMIYAAVMALIYPIGIPICIAANLWRHRGEIDPPVDFYEMSRAQEELDSNSLTLNSLKATLKAKLSMSTSSIFSKEIPPGRRAKKGNVPAPVLVSMNTGRQYRAVVSKESRHLAAIKKRDDNPEIQHLIFIYDDYKPSSMYFEVFECVRKVFLSAVLTFCVPGSWMQIVIGLMSCQLTLKILQHFQPYANAGAGAAAETAQRVLFMSLVFGLLLFTAEHTNAEIVGLDFGPTSTLSHLMSVTIILGAVLGIILGFVRAVTEVEFRQGEGSKEYPSEATTCQEVEDLEMIAEKGHDVENATGSPSMSLEALDDENDEMIATPF